MFIPVLKSDISKEEFENIYDNIANVFLFKSFFLGKIRNKIRKCGVNLFKGRPRQK